MDSTVSSEGFAAHIENTDASTPVQNNLLRLHRALINHVLVSTRVFYAHDASAWNEFVTDIPSYKDLSTEEYRNIFLNDVLPNVFIHPLPNAIKVRLKIFDLHPCYRRLAQGYQYVPIMRVQWKLKPNVDYSLPSEVSRAKTCHTFLVDADEVPKNPAGYLVQLSPQTLALFSSIMSTDQELLLCQLHPLAEILRRMRADKESFENTGKIIHYRKDIKDLSKCLETFVKLKTKFCQILSDF